MNTTRLLAYVTATSERLGALASLTQSYVAERTETARRRFPPNTWQAAWDAGQRWTAEDAFAAAAQALEARGQRRKRLPQVLPVRAVSECDSVAVAIRWPMALHRTPPF